MTADDATLSIGHTHMQMASCWRERSCQRENLQITAQYCRLVGPGQAYLRHAQAADTLYDERRADVLSVQRGFQGYAEIVAGREAQG
jgi:hypothetical protein